MRKLRARFLLILFTFWKLGQKLWYNKKKKTCVLYLKNISLLNKICNKNIYPIKTKIWKIIILTYI